MPAQSSLPPIQTSHWLYFPSLWSSSHSQPAGHGPPYKCMNVIFADVGTTPPQAPPTSHNGPNYTQRRTWTMRICDCAGPRTATCEHGWIFRRYLGAAVSQGCGFAGRHAFRGLQARALLHPRAGGTLIHEVKLVQVTACPTRREGLRKRTSVTLCFAVSGLQP